MDPRIDVFCHILPQRFDEARWPHADRTHFTEHSPTHIKFVEGDQTPPTNYRVLTDLESRFRLMDELEGYRQMLSVATPAPEVVSPEDSDTLSKNLNDEMAELVARHPRYFVGAVATLPMNKPDAAARELERCMGELGLLGVQLFSTVLEKPLDLPEFRPILELLNEKEVPILLHPARSRQHPDYLTENISKYMIWQIFGWPYESTVAMSRLVFSGIMEDLPKLKIVTHHTGAMIPFFSGRIEAMMGMFGGLIEAESGRVLEKPVIEYFRRFYADTSTYTRESIENACNFFGVDHVLFGTDVPFDAEGGRISVRGSTDAVEQSSLTAAERSQIYYKNFEKMFGVSAAPASG